MVALSGPTRAYTVLSGRFTLGGLAMAESQVALLIDMENVGLDPIKGLFDALSDVGRVTVKRAYADWSKSAHRDQLLELGIEPIQVFRAGNSGKNASDIRLAVDAIDLLHQSPVDVFVIVSADSDFVPVVNRLRAGGKTVIGAGRRATAPSTLVRSCDRYIYLDQKRVTAATRAPTSSRRSVDQAVEQDVLTRAVRASMDGQGTVVGSKLHSTILRLDPTFDYKSLGYSTFVRFLEDSPAVSVSRPSGPGDVVATLVEGTTEPGNWDRAIDAAWSERARSSGDIIAGPNAAADAAVALSVSKLSASKLSTLQKLLDFSAHLNERWRREKNSIVRR